MQHAFCLIAIVASVVLGAGGASAATLNVVGGELLGASGVIVDGNSYDVQFLDGTCIALYSGCDEVSDFTFQSSAAADLASQALLDQVFIDGVGIFFDAIPELTNGCTLFSLCDAITPFSVDAGNVFAVFAENVIGDPDTSFATGIGPNTFDSSGVSQLVYAVWAPVPEPNTALLLSMGLAGLGWRGRELRAS